MTRFVETRVVPADLATTRALVLDWTRDPEWRTAVTSMTADPPGPATRGQRLLETMRFAGATFTTPTHIVDADDTSARFEGGSAMVRVSGRRLLEPTDERDKRDRRGRHPLPRPGHAAHLAAGPRLPAPAPAGPRPARKPC